MILYGIASAVSDDNLAVAALSRYMEMQLGLCRSMGEFTQCHNPAHGNEAEPNGCHTTELSTTKLNEPLLIVPVTVAEPSL
jgi:hypothetical protein